MRITLLSCKVCSGVAACGGGSLWLQFRSPPLARYTTWPSGHDLFLPSPPAAGDRKCNHFTVVAPEAAPKVGLPFSGARGPLNGTGTMCHCRPTRPQSASTPAWSPPGKPTLPQLHPEHSWIPWASFLLPNSPPPLLSSNQQLAPPPYFGSPSDCPSVRPPFTEKGAPWK